jgi:hypothetical protein
VDAERGQLVSMQNWERRAAGSAATMQGCEIPWRRLTGERE